jgi:hypothetical protein
MASKPNPPKKKAPGGKKINVAIDLGPLTPKVAPDQIERLKAYVENHLLTWVKSDLKEKSVPPIVCEEFSRPPQAKPYEDDVDA